MRLQNIQNVRWWMIPLGIVAFPIVLMLVIVVLLWLIVMSLTLYLAAWWYWNPKGLDVLFVYSNSPVWQEHIETEILPLIRERAVVLNWSERQQWRAGLARAMFHHFGGSREFNPLAVVFRPYRRARVFRFWRAFRDWKHGRPKSLFELEAEFFKFIGLTKGAGPEQ